jgi:hypothetical protein
MSRPVAHPIHLLKSFRIDGPYILWMRFDDRTERVINFEQLLSGQLYRPLRDLEVFNRVRIDPEVHTLVWPNGADFDPETLHDWPRIRRVAGRSRQAMGPGPDVMHVPGACCVIRKSGELLQEWKVASRQSTLEFIA